MCEDHVAPQARVPTAMIPPEADVRLRYCESWVKPEALRGRLEGIGWSLELDEVSHGRVVEFDPHLAETPTLTLFLIPHCRCVAEGVQELGDAFARGDLELDFAPLFDRAVICRRTLEGQHMARADPPDPQHLAACGQSARGSVEEDVDLVFSGVELFGLGCGEATPDLIQIICGDLEFTFDHSVSLAGRTRRAK